MFTCAMMPKAAIAANAETIDHGWVAPLRWRRSASKHAMLEQDSAVEAISARKGLEMASTGMLTGNRPADVVRGQASLHKLIV
jgi:hypothetical protein